jgi:hypothetical protein
LNVTGSAAEKTGISNQKAESEAKNFANMAGILKQGRMEKGTGYRVLVTGYWLQGTGMTVRRAKTLTSYGGRAAALGCGLEPNSIGALVRSRWGNSAERRRLIVFVSEEL